jgi:SAM-dependent methyltransferase
MHHHSQNPSLLWRFEEGNMVDVIARELFPDGVMIHGHGADVQKQTQDQIKAGATTIFQAAAVADRIMAIADIIRFNPETKKWDIFEVKNSTEVKKEHIHDVCFQRIAFRKAGFNIGRVHLVYVNGDYLRAGSIDPRSFLIIKDITEEVDEVEDTVEADITKAPLEANRYDLWHDRAVFHFLTNPEDRKKYVEQLKRSLKHQGHIIISTFSLKGPLKCSGLEIVRYSPETLKAELGKDFALIESAEEEHPTPFGSTQAFVYCHFKKVVARYTETSAER